MHNRTLSLLQESLKLEIEKIFREDVAIAIDAFLDGVLVAATREKHFEEIDNQAVAHLRKDMQETVKHKATLHLESMLKGLEKSLIELSILLHHIKNRI
ncbi:MAG: hypothetical protein AAF770_03195 [Bacteroidota bacterium]